MTLLRLSHAFRTAWFDGDVVARGHSTYGGWPRLSFGSQNRSKILKREIEREMERRSWVIPGEMNIENKIGSKRE